jgi:flagellar biosynthetic protein FlhB
MAEEPLDDDSEKTEEPTQKRLDQALERGQKIYSKEVTNFLIILTAIAIISWLLPSAMLSTSSYLAHYFDHADSIRLDEGSIGYLSVDIIKHSGMVIIFPLLLLMMAALFSSFLQNGKFVISTEAIMPKLEKVSPIAGFKRLFSITSAIELLKSLIKIIVVGIAIYMTVHPKLKKIENLYQYTILGTIRIIAELTLDMFIITAIILAFLAAMDYFYQRYQYYKKLRMSLYEVKKEFKETEGNPEIKAKLRAIRQERAKNRMMSAVPQADVVITNPTHFSVALKYDATKMKAPILVAKGQDLIALRIREIAKENDVPIVENPPLARVLFKTVDIDEAIPVEHYKAVAEVISYVYSLRKK